MRRYFRLLLVGSFAIGGALAQTAAIPAGVAPAWDMRETLRGLVEQTERFQKVVEQIQPSGWVAKGAPDAYVGQRDVVKREVGYLRTVAGRLYESPERLPLALDAFFRLQSLETYTLSLSDGAKRYQSEQLGSELATLLAQNDGVRAKLRQYVIDLSVTKETEYTVAEKEAQRCQSVLNRNPLAPEPKRNPAPAPSPVPAVKK